LTARAASADAPLRYVSLEARFGWHDAAWNRLIAAAPSSWKLHRERLAGESHQSMVMISMYVGLRAAFGDYSMLAAPVAPTTSILPYYARLNAAFGASVVPPRRLLLNVVEDFLMEGRGAAAREAYNMLVSGYGKPDDSVKLLAKIEDVERRPPPAETVEGLLATPFPTPEQVRQFIGEWVGDVWMSPDEPRTGKLRLRVGVVDGQVIGETIRRTPEGEEIVQRWEYLKVTPSGLTWGNLNGMRPRGVVLFEGKLEGDTLSGTNRFGGIDFRPEGLPNDPVHFSFKRLRK
ncbi:MAG TPA: hypothetical protein VJQ56_07400, partial [Blastocatellia bacterium]|nr:hypothetical protein [Blastocatellia bacterium]